MSLCSTCEVVWSSQRPWRCHNLFTLISLHFWHVRVIGHGLLITEASASLCRAPCVRAQPTFRCGSPKILRPWCSTPAIRWTVCHSTCWATAWGGQTTPLLPSSKRVKGLINIAVGSGSIRHNHPRIRRSAPLLWYVLAPVACPLFGYFPGSRLGVLGDIPKRVFFQWRRWCLTPEYLLTGEPGAREAYAQARFPVLGLTFSDDELLMEAGSRLLHDAYTGTELDYRVLSPQQFGLNRVGHFGFFKASHEKVLWPMVIEWLHKQSPQTRYVPTQ